MRILSACGLAVAALVASTVSAAPMAYIANFGSNTVTVIDVATDFDFTAIGVGAGSQPFAVAASPDGNKVYVTRQNNANLSVISTAANTVVATINVGTGARGVAITPDSSRVYVAMTFANSVSIIDTATDTVTGVVAVGANPQGIAVSADGTKVYVANGTDNTVSVIATATNAVIATVPVAGNPQGLASSPDGTRMYVANLLDGSVATIDTATNTVTATVSVGSFPYGITVTPNGAGIYVTNSVDNSVSLINTATNTVSATIAVGSRPQGISVTPDGSKVYVANNNGNSVSVIATATNAVIATIPVGTRPISFGSFISPGPPPPPALTVNKTGSATSVVTSDPAGIDCGATCSASFASGSMVTLSATPAGDVTFAGWSGACSGTGSCSVTMNGSQAVTAAFALIPVAQSISFGPAPVIAVGSSGTVTATGGGSGNPVTFTAVTPATCSVSGANGATVTGVASGNCVIAANQAGAAGFLPAPQVTRNIAIIPAGQPLALLAVQSRKNHGAAGLKDLPIDTTATFDGAVSVEPRAQAGGTSLVFQFNDAVSSVGPITVSDEASVILDATVSFSGNQVTVVLAPVADNKRVHIAFASINGIPVDADVSLGLLGGDVNASRSVNAADVAVAKSRSGNVIDDNSVRYDINASGVVTAADIAAIKARSAANVPFTAIVAPSIANVAIEQSGLLLSQVGASRQLVAKVTDALGRRLNVPVSWSSSRAANIAVDGNGLATASSLNGVTQIVATAGGVSSAPLLAVATVPASGAILLDDEQIVGEPAETNAAAVPSASNTYTVTLAGTPPAVGSLLISTGSKIVAGRVLQVDGSNPAVVTLGLVTLREMFPTLDIDETIEMRNAPVTIPGDIAADYDVVRTGDTYTFTPKSGAAVAAAAGKAAALPNTTLKGRADKGISRDGPVGTSALPPFTNCDTTITGSGPGAPLPIVLSAPPLFSVSINPTLDFKYNAAGAQGVERFIVRAKPTIKVEGGVNVVAAFEGKVECKADLFVFRVPVGGPLALIIGGLVPVGVGFEAGGKITLATMGIGSKVELSADAKAGFSCVDGGFDCNLETGLDIAPPKFTPTLNAPSIGDIRLEPKFSAFGFVDTSVGNPFFKSLRFNFIKIKASADLLGSFALKQSQLADPLYKSDYKLQLKAGVTAGSNLSDALRLFGLSSITAVELAITTDIAKSPGALATGAVVADKDTFVTGETVNFTVKLDPATVDFLPIIGPYNVKKIQLVRDQTGTPTVVGSVDAAPGQTVFNIAFSAPNSGTASQFSAFVVTTLLPLDLLALEVGSAGVEVRGDLTAGRGHTCALTASRGVKCWGDNSSGQLGDGTNTSRSAPVDVLGLSSGVTAVAAGSDHTCALLADGSVKCWGANFEGMLGDGTTISRNVPTDVVGLTSGIVAISAASSATCALTSAGAVKCWGNNRDGQLADGTYVDKLTPNASALSGGVTALSAGSNQSCVQVNGGGIKCWGYSLGFEGPAPDFKDQYQTVPVTVGALGSSITSIAADGFSTPTCGVTSAGAIKCWDLSGLAPSPPYNVGGFASGVVAIAVGGSQLCALTTTGGVRCGSSTNSTAPVDVSGLASGVTGIAAGFAHACARTASRGVKCWGQNIHGQLGNGTTTASASAVDVAGFP